MVYSGESSEYHGFQTQASLYSFVDSRQGEAGGMWTRLLTSSQPDDVMDTFPTFYAKRHPYSKRCGGRPPEGGGGGPGGGCGGRGRDGGPFPPPGGVPVRSRAPREGVLEGGPRRRVSRGVAGTPAPPDPPPDLRRGGLLETGGLRS